MRSGRGYCGVARGANIEAGAFRVKRGRDPNARLFHVEVVDGRPFKGVKRRRGRWSVCPAAGGRRRSGGERRGSASAGREATAWQELERGPAPGRIQAGPAARPVK